jgi:hypothetical protein
MVRLAALPLPALALALLAPLAASAQIAGPDTYGYTVDATAYDWVDLSTGGGASVGISSTSSRASSGSCS